jgi:SAM-dependent methyltransferase
MCVCEGCGFISYPDKWKAKEEIFAHYRDAYRQPPTHFNVYAGARKNNYHLAFLHQTFEEWKARGLKNPKILEVGAAFGFTLQWLKQLFPEATIHGTELTASYRKVAYYEFGVQLDEDIDDTEKYDLIVSYKVLEHQLDPDLELLRYQKMLTKDGVFYLSVPTWLDSMINFGLGGFDLEYYYDLNHINVWTRPIIEGMLHHCGFEVIKKNYETYSATYLLKANDNLLGTGPTKEDVSVILEKLKSVKEAFMQNSEGQFTEAIKTWPNYPHAWTQLLEMNRKKIAELGWLEFKKQFILPMLEACVESGAADAYDLAADFALRAGAFEESIRYCEQSLASRPENPAALHRMTNLMREMALKAKDAREKSHYFGQALEVARHLRTTSPQHFKEATDLIYLYMSHLPLPMAPKKAKSGASVHQLRKDVNHGAENTL